MINEKNNQKEVVIVNCTNDLQTKILLSLKHADKAIVNGEK